MYLPVCEADADYNIVGRAATHQLRYYKAHTISPQAPIVICYALINRVEILTLTHQESLLAALRAERDVYLIDWGDITAPTQAKYSFEHYLNSLQKFIEQIQQHSSQSAIHLMGICQGGVLALCLAALYPKYVLTLTLMVTPVDYHCPGNLLYRRIEHLDLKQLCQYYPIIPARFIEHFFAAMRPHQLLVGKYLTQSNNRDIERHGLFYRVESWLKAGPNLSGQFFYEFCQDIVLDNRLKTGGLSAAGRLIELSDICCPILNIYASHDDIAPIAAVTALKAMTSSSHYDELEFSGGHIGVFISRQAKSDIFPQVNSFLSQHSVG